MQDQFFGWPFECNADHRDTLIQKLKQLLSNAHYEARNTAMKSSLAAVKRQRFPAQASRRVRGLFILGLGSSCEQ